ncbi:MAG: hypothetical protein NTV55_14385 [Planctomycetota bacterium]|nr:hypothetical protein [Planctomycetota bacterium]
MEQMHDTLLKPSEARLRLNSLQGSLTRYLAGGMRSRRTARRNRLMLRLDLPCNSLESFFWSRHKRQSECCVAGNLIDKLLDGLTSFRPERGNLGSWMSSAIHCDVLDLLKRETTAQDHAERLKRHTLALRRRGETPVGSGLERQEFFARVEDVVQTVVDPVEAAIGRRILQSLRETGDMPVQTTLAEALGVSDPLITRGKQALFAKLRGPLAGRAVVFGPGFAATTPVQVLKA